MTLGELIEQISNDLDGQLTDAEIRTAIKDAIDLHAHRPFWWNKTRTVTFPTVAGQEFYGVYDNSTLPNVFQIDLVEINDGGTEWELCRRHDLEVDADPSVGQSLPYEYAVFNNKIRLFPIPDGVYTIRVVGRYKLSELTDDLQENEWTNEGRMLIRAEAKSLLYAHILDDDRNAAKQAALATNYLRKLQSEGTRRSRTGQIVPTTF
jgi:hypothetical protein